MFVYKLSGCGFESRCSDLNFRYRVTFESGVPWHSGNYGMHIHFRTRMWHYKNVQSSCHPCNIFEYVYLGTFHVKCLLNRRFSHGQRISYLQRDLERTDNKLFSGLIGPRHMNASRAVVRQVGGKMLPSARCFLLPVI